MKKISVLVMLLLSPLLYAESETMQPAMDTMAGDTMTGMESSTTSNGQVVPKLAASFDNFLGEQAITVIKGLRNGEEFTLTSSYTDASGTQQTETITIEPPTSKMGYGNVKITLRMAENLLNQSGISQPTAIQLETALLGGSLTTANGNIVDVDGVLTLRSEGMGWGQIASQYDTKVGTLLGNANSKSVSTATKNHGITTAAADSVVSPGNGKLKAPLKAKAHSYGQGIVTASGASVGADLGASNGNAAGKAHGGGHAFGKGIVSAGGSSVAHGNAGGNGKGHGRVK